MHTRNTLVPNASYIYGAWALVLALSLTLCGLGLCLPWPHTLPALASPVNEVSQTGPPKNAALGYLKITKSAKSYVF